MTTEMNAERLGRIKSMLDSDLGNEGHWNKIMPKPELYFLIEQAERAQELEAFNNRCVQVARNRQKHIDHIESESEEITDILVKMRGSFTEKDEQAEGRGMEDAVACPVAVAQYAFNKYERTLNENARLRKALEDMKRSFNAEFAPMMTHDAKVYLSSRIDAALKGESE